MQNINHSLASKSLECDINLAKDQDNKEAYNFKNNIDKNRLKDKEKLAKKILDEVYVIPLSLFEHDNKKLSLMQLSAIDPNISDKALLKINVARFLRCILYEWLDYIIENNHESVGAQMDILLDSVKSLVVLWKDLVHIKSTKPYKKTITNDLLLKIAQIFRECSLRNYVNANSIYLRLSIGNNPWPIGVTMVNIHERSAHDKLKKVTHVLNDEATRKWIQSIKRLIRICQNLYPPNDSLQLWAE